MKFQSKLVVFLITCVCSDARISSSKHGHEEKGISQDDRSRKLVSYLEAHVLCGSGSSSCAGGVPKIVDANDENEKYGVRCCYDYSSSYKESSSSFQKRSGCDVWTDSHISECHASKTFTDAVALCDSNFGRLCTSNEIASNCAEASGCGLDNRLIWTSPTGPAQCPAAFNFDKLVGNEYHLQRCYDDRCSWRVKTQYSNCNNFCNQNGMMCTGAKKGTTCDIASAALVDDVCEASIHGGSDNWLCTCRDGWSTDFNKQWAAVDIPKTFAEAEAHCETIGAKLAAPQNDDENAFMQSVFPTESIWFGYRCAEADCTSISTWDLTYQNFNSGQPNCNGCGSAISGVGVCTGSHSKSAATWNDNNCGELKKFLCQKVSSLAIAEVREWRTDFNKQWLAVDIPKTFADAEAHCETIGATLAAPQNDNENTFMQSEFPTKEIWFGYRCAATDCTSVSTWNLTYQNFNSGQPNCNKCGSAISGVGVCTGSHSASAATWNDNGCGELKRFLCQK